jgi:HTH-type transcriptional regulator/antitoxin HigA
MTNSNYEVPLPGMFIQDELDARGLSQRDLAFILGIEEGALNKIVKGKTGVSIEMSKALAKAFDVDADFFSNLQKAFDLANSAAVDPSIERRAVLQNKYPVREMIKRNWIKNADVGSLEKQLTAFFRAENDNVSQIRHAAKKTNSGEDATPAQLAWLYRVMQIAEAMVCKPYSTKALSNATKELKSLMLQASDVARVVDVLAECGLRLVIVEGLPNAKIDGVCLWLDPAKPVIGLSLRQDRIDNFWFVLWHELLHVMNSHGKTDPIIDVELEGERAGDSDAVSAQEREANRYAAEQCVPQHEVISFLAKRRGFVAEREVVMFAERMRVHPGILVGQIQKRTERWSLLRKHLVKIREYILPVAVVDGWGHVAPVSI